MEALLVGFVGRRGRKEVREERGVRGKKNSDDDVRDWVRRR